MSEELPYDVWRAREAAHHQRVGALLAGHLARRERGEKHPVEDFLWVYYSHRPGQLRRWHPGAGVTLLGDDDPRGRRTWRFYRTTHTADAARADHATRADHAEGTTLDVPAFLATRDDAVAWIDALLTATARRPPTYSCFGLHEWAMVHGLREGERRHEQLDLRLGQAATNAVVETATIRCSHADAYRFFTPTSAPRNELRPTRATQADHEQPGCVHATMDLYKWAFKLSPAVPSELVLDCLDLALAARRLDMQASPYDVSGFGLAPVPVETGAGRAQYVARQRELVARAEPLRARLIAATRALLTPA